MGHIGTITPDRGGPGSNGNERLLHTLQSTKIEPLPQNTI